MEEILLNIRLPILAGLISFALVYLMIPIIIKVAIKNDWVDQPDARKVHKTPIPRLGGIAIVIAMLTGLALFFKEYNLQNLSIFIGMLLLIGIGIWDDFKNLPAKFRLVVQFIIAGIVVIGGGLQLNSLFGIFNIYELPIFFQIGFSMFIIVAFINAFNFIDGIDGLAGGFGAIDSLFFCIIFFYLKEYDWLVWSAIILGGLLAFLRFNFNPAKIFMGDTGSTLLGFLIAIWSLKTLHCNYFEYDTYNISNAFVLVFAVLLPPLLDITRTVAMRILRGKHPFSPDKTHVHHYLLQTRFSPKEAMLILCLGNVILLVISFLLKDILSIQKSIFLLIIICFLMKEFMLLKKITNYQTDYKKMELKEKH